MKFKFLYTLTFLIFGIGLNFNFSSGPANNGFDRTGSPIEDRTCIQCHTGNAFGPSLSIELLDADGTSVTEYIPGETYNLVFDMATTTDPAAYGLQAVVLDGDANNAGVFGALPDEFQFSNLNGVSYFEHARRLSNSTNTIAWTAPPAGTEDVTIYASGIAANGNGANSGDGTSNNSLLLMEASSSSTNDASEFNFNLQLLGNPVTDQLPIRVVSETSENLRLNFLDMNGRTVQQENINIFRGEQTLRIDLDFGKGIYFLQLSDGNNATTTKLLKL